MQKEILKEYCLRNKKKKIAEKTSSVDLNLKEGKNPPPILPLPNFILIVLSCCFVEFRHHTTLLYN